MIPVSRPYLDDDELASIKEVFDSRWLGLGKQVKEFQERVCQYINAPAFLATNTGTTAIHLALRALGIGKGDEVIVPAFTFVASVQAITASGAEPVFCDIDESTLNIDVTKVGELINERTKAILPVHYRGEACNMDALLNIANNHNIYVIEDAAHAFGSAYNGKKIGSFGHVTCFSFDPIKNITCGEGGGIVFQDNNFHLIAERMRILGIGEDTLSRYENKRKWQYDVISEGYRYHMPNFCAAIGLKQLDKAEVMRERKVNICRRYDAAFADLKHIKISPMNYQDTYPFMYVALAEKREEFISFLESRGVGAGIHYIPAHNFSFYQNCRKSDLSVTDRISLMNTTLPLYYEMTDDQVDLVIQSVIEFDQAGD